MQHEWCHSNCLQLLNLLRTKNNYCFGASRLLDLKLIKITNIWILMLFGYWQWQINHGSMSTTSHIKHMNTLLLLKMTRALIIYYYFIFLISCVWWGHKSNIIFLIRTRYNVQNNKYNLNWTEELKNMI